LSDGKTVVVTEGGKITELKEMEVEAMKDEKPSEMEATFMMLAEELKAIRDELTTIKAAQGAPAPVAAAPVARKVAPTVAAKAPAADTPLDKTQKVNDGWNVLAKFAQKHGEQKHNLKFN
jgi:hypothetical protein